MTSCQCCSHVAASCITDLCETCCECGRTLQERKTGYLVIKVEYLPKHRSVSGEIDLEEISSEADYQVEHPGVVATELMGYNEEYPL